MRIVLEVVATQRQLDVVTVKGSQISYETGAAKEVMDNTVQRIGARQAAQRFKSWSNGYLRTREVPTPR